MFSSSITQQSEFFQGPSGSEYMHITLCFGPTGEVNFYPDPGRNGPRELVRALARVALLLSQNPRLILCVAGACGGKDGACQ